MVATRQTCCGFPSRSPLKFPLETVHHWKSSRKSLRKRRLKKTVAAHFFTVSPKDCPRNHPWKRFTIELQLVKVCEKDGLKKRPPLFFLQFPLKITLEIALGNGTIEIQLVKVCYKDDLKNDRRSSFSTVSPQDSPRNRPLKRFTTKIPPLLFFSIKKKGPKKPSALIFALRNSEFLP